MRPRTNVASRKQQHPVVLVLRPPRRRMSPNRRRKTSLETSSPLSIRNFARRFSAKEPLEDSWAAFWAPPAPIGTGTLAERARLSDRAAGLTLVGELLEDPLVPLQKARRQRSLLSSGK